jgi:hypothetical protein
MAYTTINKSTDYFNTKLYTGTGSSNALTGVGFQPDMTWIKERGAIGDHFVCDAVRGVTKYILPNATGVEGTNANTLTAFGADGFTVGSDGWTNNNTDTYASWNWKANGAGSANTDGSINSTATSANTTAGFSISKYTGTGSNATVGHGLGVVPKMIIVKRLDGNDSWWVYNEAIGNGAYLVLSSTGSSSTSGAPGLWNSTSPTSSVFSVGTNGGVNASGGTYIAYCFAEKTGYSKFGSYTGNGNADGTFVYTGFKPAWVMVKATSISNEAWKIYDNKRNIFNVSETTLNASDNSAEGTGSGNYIDILSNGLKIRSNDTRLNQSGQTYIYMAFGQSLVGSNNTPCTAR